MSVHRVRMKNRSISEYMAKVNKLALIRLALHQTILDLDTKELLCVLADLYVGGFDSEAPRWFGNGDGANGLQQGIYNYMTSFRRVSNLWAKITHLVNGDKDLLRQEIYVVRDLILKKLNDRGVDLTDIEERGGDGNE